MDSWPSSPRLATYRLQLHRDFDFDDAAAIVDYLAALGISHLYLSPVLQAVAGSMHGYDVVDPSRLSDDLGGERGWEMLLRASSTHGLGRLVDIVPNHMAITGPENVWWWDVLENGASSVYAAYFDVEWHPETQTHDQVLLPILGDHYGRELEAGRFDLRRSGPTFVIGYFDHVVPVNPRSLDTVLAQAATRLSPGEALGPRAVLEHLATALGRLPTADSTDMVSVVERHRDKQILAADLGRLCLDYPEVAAALDAQVSAINASPDTFDALLARQNYRLASWRIASQELDYRRFFDINDLAGIRVEDPRVFADSHRLPLRWLADGDVEGVRIDHVDGLWDPAEYLRRLTDAAPTAWVVVEKILERDEQLPSSWPVAGTTGYDWLATVGDVLVDPPGVEAIEGAYRRFTGDDVAYVDAVRAAKHEVLAGSLATDLNRLVARLVDICHAHRRYRDYTRRDLYDALREVVAAFPVYRTYVVPGTAASEADTAVIEATFASVRKRRPDLDDELLSFVASILSGRLVGNDEVVFSRRMQQLTSPVMAKAVEDTVFYRYLALVSRNEVGSDPGAAPIDLGEFHRRCRVLQEAHPHGLLATSTHDTKRAEDVRARVAVLAEMPREWEGLAERWSSHMNRRTGADGASVDPATIWLIFQTLVGAWPIGAERLVAYLQKATREAKLHTSWTDPNEAYDEAVQSFAVHCLEDEVLIDQLEELVGRLRRHGWSNALAQKLLTLTGPGVADLYQGSELWDLSLVDPDNRRPVDYSERRKLLEVVARTDPGDLWAAEQGSGATKLAVVRAALAMRAERPEAFGPGEAGRYEPLSARGQAASHVVASLRGGQVAVVATRLPLGLAARGGWGDTVVDLPAGKWQSRLGDGEWEGEVALRDLLAGLPVALLVLSPQGEEQ